MALGAKPRNVLASVVGQGIALAAGGALLGLGAAFVLTRWMQALLYDVSPTDPWTFAAVPAVLVTIALAASYIPARRATHVDPVRALKLD
jgi:ABC-type antimicrobial peptide transport system permease subunit